MNDTTYEPTQEYTAEQIGYLDDTRTTIRNLWQTSQQARWDIGAALIEVKTRYAGAWLAFVSELPFSHDTATRMMTYAAKLPRPVLGHELPTMVLYALTDDRIPAQVRADALNARVGCVDALELMAKAHHKDADEYASIVASGGFYIDAEFVPLQEAKPRDVRAYERAQVAAVMAAKYTPYTFLGTIEPTASGTGFIVTTSQDIPKELNNRHVRVRIEVETE